MEIFDHIVRPGETWKECNRPFPRIVPIERNRGSYSPMLHSYYKYVGTDNAGVVPFQAPLSYEDLENPEAVERVFKMFDYHQDFSEKAVSIIISEKEDTKTPRTVLETKTVLQKIEEFAPTLLSGNIHTIYLIGSVCFDYPTMEEVKEEPLSFWGKIRKIFSKEKR